MPLATSFSLILILLTASPLFGKVKVKIKTPTEIGSFIDFFYTADQKTMLGLSCSSEGDCKIRCDGTAKCQKPIDTCLNCVGSRSPYINDFFNNMGDLTTTCFDHSLNANESEALFNSVQMVPLTINSAFNPLGLRDQALTDRFAKLCPIDTIEPTAIAFTNDLTHGIIEIPLVKCGKVLYPLVRSTEDCAAKTQWIRNFIQINFETRQKRLYNYETAVRLMDQLPLKYDILKLSEFAESHYVGCDSKSWAVCDKLCGSSLSCSIPLENQNTARAISIFHRQKWTDCGTERFSTDRLVSYIQASDGFAFSAQSLWQSYDLPALAGGFSDFAVIDSILHDFTDVFVSQIDSGIEKDQSSSSFLVSKSYREKLEKQMKSLCDDKTQAVILGRGNRIERVLCRSEINGYFKILKAQNESCYQKQKDSL